MLTPLRPDKAERLRDFFAEAGYTVDGMKKVLIHNELPARHLRNLPRLLEQTRERTRLNTLLRWFALGQPVAETTARAVIPEWFLTVGFDCGLLSSQGSEISASVMLAPFNEFLIATDHSLAIEAAEDPNVVLLINPTTWTLYRFAMRHPCRATLDLGAGCGALALAASLHSEHVVASDLNPRATNYATFNAALNRRSNVECLTGDSYEPVAGRKFDLILTNPPFFITPEVSHLFCDNEMELDGFCRSLIRRAPEFLNEGGYLQMVCEWVQTKDQGWRERLSEWFEGLGCDAWVNKGHTEIPEKYASARIRETTAPDPEADAANYQAWTGYYRDHNLRAIHRGLVALRRRSGHNWTRFEEVPATPKEPFGDAIRGAFAAEDFLNANTSDDRLLTRRLRLSPETRLVIRTAPREKDWRMDAMHIHLLTGIPFSQKIEPLVAELLGSFAPPRTVATAVEKLSGKVAAKPEQVQRECLSATRRLLRRGFLIPEEEASC